MSNPQQFMMFSGGFDSTYLLNMLMMKYSEICLLSINADFLSSKNNREISTRQTLISYLKHKYPKCRLYINNLDIFSKDYQIKDFKGLIQLPLWLSSALMCTADLNDVVINFSLILSDQGLIHMNDIKDIVKSMNNFRQDKNLIAKFPLMYHTKTFLIRDLIETDKFLFENATTCEGTEIIDFCGECTPCNNLKSALVNIITDKTVKQETRDYAKDYLKRKFKIEVTINEVN